jgi:hypothetical protein
LTPLEQLEAKLTPELRAVLAPATAEERRYALAHLWLRHESLSLAVRSPREGGPCGTSEPGLKLKDVTAPRFVDAALRARAHAESQRLDALVADESTFRAEQVALWARAHRDDPRVPEDLHRAVLNTKYSCYELRAGATAASKKAWKALHDLFPKSPWTRKTKYWYP